jgi:hypothetical protein
MKSTTLRTAFAIALTCSFAGCHQPDPATRAAKRDVPQSNRPAESFQSAVTSPTRPPAPPATPDNALSEKVKDALTNTTEIKAEGLQVSAADGVVTLYGTVEAGREKQRAALIAMDVDGVRSVVNNLVVLKGSG